MITREIENINYTNYEISNIMETLRDYLYTLSKADARELERIITLVNVSLEKNEKVITLHDNLAKKIVKSGIQNDGKWLWTSKGWSSYYIWDQGRS